MAHYPTPNNPTIAKVTLVFVRDTRTMVNTFNVQRDTPWDLASFAPLATAILGWYNSFYKQAIPAAVALTQIQLRKMSATDPIAYDLPVTPSIPGTRAGVAEAGNVTVTMSERTGLAGRAYRGRMYVPGVAEADTSTDDRIASALASLLANTISALISVTLIGIGKLVVFHKPGLIPKPLDNLATQVTTYVIENIIDSQRKRLPQRGR